MTDRPEQYARRATRGLLPGDRDRVQRELQNDLEALIDELRGTGHSETEAVREALALFGDPRPVAASLARVHTLPRLQPLALMVLVAGCLLTSLFLARNPSPLLTQTAACPEGPAGCLPDHGGWVSLADLTRAAEGAGWRVTPARVTDPGMPGIANAVLSIDTGGGRFEVPAGPDHLLRARQERRGWPSMPDPNTQERGGQTYLRSEALFGMLARAPSIPVQVTQKGQTSVIELAGVRLTFPYREADPAGLFVSQQVGVALAREYGLTVAAQSGPRGPQFPFAAQVPGPGTHVLVFRHPTSPGVGYVVAQADGSGQLQAELPVQARSLVPGPHRAWGTPQTVHVLRFTGAMGTGRSLAPAQARLEAERDPD